MKHSLAPKIEITFVLLALMAYMGVFVRLFFTPSSGQAIVNENNIFGQAFFAITYLLAGLYFLSKPQFFFSSMQKMTVIWLLVIWTLLSFFWSYSPDITIRRSIALAGTTLFGVYLATHFSLTQNFKLLGISFSIAILISYILAFLSPPEIAWTGVFLTKNELTRFSLMATFVFIYLWRSTKQKIWVALIFATLILIYKSSSTTGIILAIIGIGIVLLFFILNRSRKEKKINIIILSGLLTIFVSVIILLNIEEILAFFQKDLTINGRIPLWNMVWVSIQKNPLLGYGYGGFWTGWGGPSAYVWAALSWLPPHAHNGFLDIALDLGLTGIFLYVMIYISFVMRIFKARQLSNNFALFMSFFSVFLLLYNLVENIALSRNSIVWLMTVIFFVQSAAKYQNQNNYEFVKE